MLLALPGKFREGTVLVIPGSLVEELVGYMGSIGRDSL